jgi:hypothetical protein
MSSAWEQSIRSKSSSKPSHLTRQAFQQWRPTVSVLGRPIREYLREESVTHIWSRNNVSMPDSLSLWPTALKSTGSSDELMHAVVRRRGSVAGSTNESSGGPDG